MKNIPHSIIRQLREISFKTKASLLRHVQSLLAAWNYSRGNPCTWAKRNAKRQSLLGQQRGLKATHACHAEACRQGYLAKIALVEAGKGHNTIAGIPA